MRVTKSNAHAYIAGTIGLVKDLIKYGGYSSSELDEIKANLYCMIETNRYALDEGEEDCLIRAVNRLTLNGGVLN